MEEGKKRTNYRKLYPDVKEEIYEVLERSDRKIKYSKYDLKTERCSIDYEKGTVTYIPSREDSLDRLEEQNYQFSDQSESVEDRAIKDTLIADMKSCIEQLSKEDRALISYIFFNGGTQQGYGELIGMTQRGVGKRQEKILETLRKMMGIDN
jgi:RNA polymerase sigma factor (sigma-70 family)